MKYNDLVERVGWGEEFFFEYNDSQYWISQNEDGYYLTRVVDGYTQEFTTHEELFLNGRINGLSIKSLWEEIKEMF